MEICFNISRNRAPCFCGRAQSRSRRFTSTLLPSPLPAVQLRPVFQQSSAVLLQIPQPHLDAVRIFQQLRELRNIGVTEVIGI